MQKKIFLSNLVIGFFGLVLSVHAQYAPSQPGSLGVGKVTETSVEWTFSFNGALVTEVQLFAGAETTPRMTLQVPNYAVSMVESGLTTNTRYEKRRVRAVYYGTPGAFSDYFPAATTLAKIPSVTFEPIVGSANIMLNVGDGTNFGAGLSAWQVYEETAGRLREWVSTQFLQLGPYDSGKTYVFKFRARNAIGVATEWSSPISYTIPVSTTIVYPSGSPVTPSAMGTISLKPGITVLNVRSLPSISGKRIGYMRPSQQFEVLETKNGWHRIQFIAATQGWVSGKYVQVK